LWILGAERRDRNRRDRVEVFELNRIGGRESLSVERRDAEWRERERRRRERLDL
jgi:hypothetical protein